MTSSRPSSSGQPAALSLPCRALLPDPAHPVCTSQPGCSPHALYSHSPVMAPDQGVEFNADCPPPMVMFCPSWTPAPRSCSPPGFTEVSGILPPAQSKPPSHPAPVRGLHTQLTHMPVGSTSQGQPASSSLSLTGRKPSDPDTFNNSPTVSPLLCVTCRGAVRVRSHHT